MIDTIGASAPMTQKLFKAVMAVSTKGYRRLFFRVKTQFGSFKIEVHVQSQRLTWVFSPMKYLVGHNLFGTNNPHHLVLGILGLIYDRFGLKFLQHDADFYAENGVLLSRADVNGSFYVGSQVKVIETMAMLREHFLDHGHHIVEHEGPDGIETLNMGKNSSSSTVKFYNKYLELLGNPKLSKLPYYSDLLEYAEKSVRFEVTKRTPSLLKLGLESSTDWSVSTAHAILDETLQDLGLSGQLLAELPAVDLAGLNAASRAKYTLWQAGNDLKQHYPAHTFMRDRKNFLEMGIDIGRPHAYANDAVTLSQRLSVERLRTTWPKRFEPLGAVLR